MACRRGRAQNQGRKTRLASTGVQICGLRSWRQGRTQSAVNKLSANAKSDHRGVDIMTAGVNK